LWWETGYTSTARRSASRIGWGRSSMCGAPTARRPTWCGSTTATRPWCFRARTPRWSTPTPGCDPRGVNRSGGSTDPDPQLGQPELVAHVVDDLGVVDEAVPAVQVGHLVPVEYEIVDRTADRDQILGAAVRGCIDQ